MSPASDPRPRGFSYERLAAEDETADEPVTYVDLRHHEHAGPFWSRDEGLSDDFEDWEPYGMTRSTFDACIRWNGQDEDAQEKARLLALLRRELEASVTVEGTSR